jgi:hypothetical protein
MRSAEGGGGISLAASLQCLTIQMGPKVGSRLYIHSEVLR